MLILGGLGVLALISFFRGSQPSATVGAPVESKAIQPVISNEEEWDWIDWRGVHRSVTIHRTVKANG